MNPIQALIFSLIEGLRERGVSVFKGPFGGLGSVELVLDPSFVPASAQPAPGPREEEDTPRVGADGLTSEEQELLYGHVYDAPKD
jgi:hypothetical protein